jgi:hypothetical protein
MITKRYNLGNREQMKGIRVIKLVLAKEGESVGKLLRELQEPMSGEKPCIPWIGEARIKEKLIDLIADNKLALNINGTEYQSSPGETFTETRNRIKGRMGKGRELDTTFLHLPNPNLSSSGTGTEPRRFK